jgi:hypothetical protein
MILGQIFEKWAFSLEMFAEKNLNLLFKKMSYILAGKMLKRFGIHPSGQCC